MAEHRRPNGQVQYLGTGRRKCAVARVFLRPGEGKITINGRSPEDYFLTAGQRLRILQPLQATETTGKFDLFILAHGGGMNGQADAIRMGVARALQEFNLELRQTLKKHGFLRRDPRKHERKKYGRPGAGSVSNTRNGNEDMGRMGTVPSADRMSSMESTARCGAKRTVAPFSQ